MMDTVGSKVFPPMGHRLQYKLIRHFSIEGSNAVLYRQAPQWPVPFAQWHSRFLYKTLLLLNDIIKMTSYLF